jgi:hypothetical protein
MVFQKNGMHIFHAYFPVFTFGNSIYNYALHIFVYFPHDTPWVSQKKKKKERKGSKSLHLVKHLAMDLGL